MSSFGEPSRVSSAITSNRSKVNGLYVPEYQSKMLPDSIRHELMVTPSSSAPAFGGVCILDFKEKNVVLHNLALNFNVSAVSGTTGGTLPNLNPCFFWVDRVEININGTIMQTIFGLEQFLLHQILSRDEERLNRNLSCGHYSSNANRNALFTGASNNYYLNLKSCLDVVRPAILTAGHDIQFKVYFNSLASVYNANSATGTPVCTFNSCSLVSNVSRLDQNTQSYKLQEMSKIPLQTLFHETRVGTYVVQSGITSTSLVLSQIAGNVAYIMFVVRPTASLTGTGMYNFTQLRNWQLVDGTSSSLCGGSPVPALLSASVLNSRWSKSTYCSETSLGLTDNNANYYCWSFSGDPISALRDGCDQSSRRFNGTESLQLTFNSALGASVQIDLFAYCETVCEQNASGFRKIAVL